MAQYNLNATTKNYLEEYQDGNLNNYPVFDNILHYDGNRNKYNLRKLNDPLKMYKPYYEKYYPSTTPSTRYDQKSVVLSQILYNELAALSLRDKRESARLDIHNPYANGLQRLPKPYFNDAVSISNKLVADKRIPSVVGVNFFSSNDIPVPTYSFPKVSEENLIDPHIHAETAIKSEPENEVNHDKERISNIAGKLLQAERDRKGKERMPIPSYNPLDAASHLQSPPYTPQKNIPNKRSRIQ